MIKSGLTLTYAENIWPWTCTCCSVRFEMLRIFGHGTVQIVMEDLICQVYKKNKDYLSL